MAPRAHLVLDVVTPHGEPVPGARVRLLGGGAEHLAVEVEHGVYRADLAEIADYALVVERYGVPGGFDHRTLRATLFLAERGDGTVLLAARPPDGVREGVGPVREEGGGFRVRVTLDYLWFTHVGSPPTPGNRVALLEDGEAAWSDVAGALEAARATIHVTTWLYAPTMELRRPDPLAEPEDRAVFTVQNVLEARAAAGVVVRMLLWDAPILRLPEPLRRAGEAAGDRLEVMQEKNPTLRHVFGEGWEIENFLLGGFPIGSHHQKTVIVDGRVGFVSGMNLRENDWDTPEHRVYDARRCRFDRDGVFRREVEAGARPPDHRPRHDFTARVEGPAVAHLEENFLQRWNRLLAAGAEYAAQASAVLPPAPQPATGPTQAQVVRTMPAPDPERGILDVYLRAIGAARRLIYIEDQYFRSTYISDAIAGATRAWPGLVVIVLTTEAQANHVVAGSFTRATFERIRDRRPAFELHALRVLGVDHEGRRTLEEVDNHAKLLIVDDLFLMVGSCNVNDRGFEFEGELNLAVADPELVRRCRVDLWRGYLGGDPRLTGDIAGDVAVWNAHAEQNRAYDPATAAGPPASRVFPFVPRGFDWSFAAPSVF